MRSDFELLTDEELVQHLANATKTGAACGGHGKAERNKSLAVDLRAEMEARGLPIPPVEELYSRGVFNGPGAV